MLNIALGLSALVFLLVLIRYVIQLIDNNTRLLPDEIVLNHAIDETELLQQVLSERHGKKLQIRHKVRQERAQWVKLAESNAKMSLEGHLANKSNFIATTNGR